MTEVPNIASHPTLRPPEYSRMEDEELRADFRAGELLVVAAHLDAQFRAMAGKGLGTMFGNPEVYDDYLKLNVCTVANRIRGVVGEKALARIAGAAQNFLRENPGMLNGDTNPVSRRIADFEIKRPELKIVEAASSDCDRAPRLSTRSDAANTDSGWRQISKAGIRLGPGRHSSERVIRHIKVHNGSGRSQGHKPA